MPQTRVPGVYIRETQANNYSIKEVTTAVPAFIGYTEKAEKKTRLDLILQPTRIKSLSEYRHLYGGPNLQNDPMEITVTNVKGGGFATEAFRQPALDYLLYYSIAVFFANGGDHCFIVSVGTYQAAAKIRLIGDWQTGDASQHGLSAGLQALAAQNDVTLIAVPEAVNLPASDYQKLVEATLMQCQALRDRFAIIDLYNGDSLLQASALQAARDLLGDDNLQHGAAYYPFIKTALNFHLSAAEDNVKVTYESLSRVNLGDLKSTNVELYKFVKKVIKDHRVVLPASSAVAGAYVRTDRTRGVWKAPANVSLSDVIEPVVRIDHRYQENLNVDVISGKSVNAIRYFSGRGTLVWGARTLAGNDNEWRYVSVRRFFNTVQESVKKGTEWAVFEPNDANTWQGVNTTIENYLLGLWRAGALAGAKPEQAFFVRCGLGTTMTPEDVMAGRLIVEIGMAAVRPAEFIILKLMHKLSTA